MTHPTTDDAIRIQQVAEGLMRITHADVAAEQLRRLYGEHRSTEALLALVGVAPVGPTATVDPATPVDPATTVGPATPVGGVVVVPGTRQHTIERLRPESNGCRRRGSRPVDWV